MYKFHLAAVLKHKEHLEEDLKKELGVLKRLLIGEKKKLEELKHTRKEFSNELQQKQHSAITVSENLLYVRFIEQLSLRLENQKEKVLNAEKSVESKRKDLIEVMKNRKALEKLKEKGLEIYRQNLVKKEQNFMNEMASVRFNRKM